MEWFLDENNIGKIEDDEWMGVDVEDECYVPSDHLSDVLNVPEILEVT